MVKMVSLSDEAYGILTRKKRKNMSYSQVVIEHFKTPRRKKNRTKKDLLEFIKKNSKGTKKENISENIDAILYGKEWK